MTPSGTPATPKVIARLSNQPGAPGDNGGTGSTQVVISSGNDTSSATRASMAGLKMFWPSPPKTCLPITIANPAPTTPIHHGAQGGSVMAISHPVSNADPSSKVDLTGFPASERQRASKPSAASTVTVNRNIAGSPNRNRPKAVAGISASMTWPMIA